MPPHLLVRGGGQTRLRLKGWGSPNSNEVTHTVVLYIYKYFVGFPITDDECKRKDRIYVHVVQYCKMSFYEYMSKYCNKNHNTIGYIRSFVFYNVLKNLLSNSCWAFSLSLALSRSWSPTSWPRDTGLRDTRTNTAWKTKHLLKVVFVRKLVLEKLNVSTCDTMTNTAWNTDIGVKDICKAFIKSRPY